VGRLFLELADPEVADAVAQIVGAYGMHADLLTGDVEVVGLGPALAQHADRHLGAGTPPHLFHGVGQLHVLGDQAVDLHDAIARLQPGPVGRRAFDGGHYGQNVVAERDLDAQPAEAARGLDLHLPIALGVQERAVRVQAAQSALDGAVDQLLGRHFVYVLVLDDGQHLGEQPELLVRRPVLRALAGHGPAERQSQHDEQ
jgi:hypothetical protein